MIFNNPSFVAPRVVIIDLFNHDMSIKNEWGITKLSVMVFCIIEIFTIAFVYKMIVGLQVWHKGKQFFVVFYCFT